MVTLKVTTDFIWTKLADPSFPDFANSGGD